MIAVLMMAAALAGPPGTLPLRDGAWGSPCAMTDPGCTVIVVQDGAMVGMADGQILRKPLRLIPGDPPLLQFHFGEGEDFIDLNDAADAPRVFFGVRINARDAQGRVTGLSLWQVWCPVPADGKASAQAGVRWDATRQACIVDGKAAIRAAAVRDRSDYELDVLSFSWLREARPEDLKD